MITKNPDLNPNVLIHTLNNIPTFIKKVFNQQKKKNKLKLKFTVRKHRGNFVMGFIKFPIPLLLDDKERMRSFKRCNVLIILSSAFTSTNIVFTGRIVALYKQLWYLLH